MYLLFFYLYKTIVYLILPLHYISILLNDSSPRKINLYFGLQKNKWVETYLARRGWLLGY